MHIETAGRGNPPVIFVHGFACDLSDWQAQFDRLQENTTVVACDLRGHGSTPGLPEDCSIETYGADVASLIASLNLAPAILVGHSMGCRVVLESCRTAPDRVAGIVLIDGSSIAAGERSTAQRGMSEQLNKRGYEEFIRSFFEAMFTSTTDPSLKAAIIDRALRLPADIGMALLPRLAGWDAAQLRGALDSVHVPLMAIQTTTLDSDRVRVPLPAGETSTWLELLRDNVPNPRIETLAGQGHFPQLEMAEDVSSLISDFVLGIR